MTTSHSGREAPDRHASQTEPHAPEQVVVNGLQNDVEVLIDRWGLPHIYADSAIDAYTAQGVQAARDRLFQIDLWRRRGLGLLSEVLGPKHVAQDRATRLFLYRGDMRAEWLSYSTDARDIVTAFVNGINAHVEWVLQEPQTRMPPEFHELGYSPAHWNPEDVVRIRTHGLLYNAEQELARALTLRDLGPAAEELRAVREPVPAHEGQLDLGLYNSLSDGTLDIYRLAFAPVDFGADTAAEASTPSGSNNWVVAPSRSATGRPILANDPHRAVTLPSLRYLAHLEAPGLSVIGAGEPNLPGISIGHNGRVAFGLTIWPADHEDIYIYDLHPEDDNRYLYKGAWEEFETVEERAAVNGSADVVHTLTYTRHGPVIHIDAENRRAVAIRAVWLQPGMAPYMASLEYQDADDADQFRRALRRWGAPGVNMVYASADGDIGWQSCGLVPHRPNWDGSRPVPGDGRYEWDGFASVEELPSVLNPDSGWFTTSNEHNLPSDYDNDALTTTTDWYTSGRHERLVDWLSHDESVTIATSIGMHSNADNLHGRRLLDQLKSLTPETHASEWAELQFWDGTESVESSSALLYQVWQRRHLRPWLVDHALERLQLSPDAVAAAKHRLLRGDTLFSDIRPDLRMVDMFDLDNDEDRVLISAGLTETLGSALAEIESLLGSDRTDWKWGRLHRTTLRHPVLSKAAVANEWGELPSVPRAGSGDTVGLTGYDADFNAVMGSSFRITVDVGNWDETQVVNSPGQSGDPRSSHYSDLLELWADNETLPLLYSRDSIEDSVEKRLILRPDPSPMET